MPSGRPVFLVGCPRSGTTLLRDLLRSLPNLTFPFESHFIPGFYRAYGDPHNDVEALRLATRVLRLHYIRRWQLGVAPAHFASCRSYRDFVARLFECWAAKENKPRWGDKTPNYLTDIPTLLELFPEAQILHIYRDGRDVAMSWCKSGFEPGNLYTAARLWQLQVRQAMAAGRRLPTGSYFEIAYEDLVSDTRGTMARVCQFLEEPSSDQVLTPTRLWPLKKGEINQVFKNSGKWTTQMSPAQRCIVESVAGSLLGELGYPLEATTRQISAAERFFWDSHHSIVRAARHLWWSLSPAAARTGVENQLAALRSRWHRSVS